MGVGVVGVVSVHVAEAARRVRMTAGNGCSNTSPVTLGDEGGEVSPDEHCRTVVARRRCDVDVDTEEDGGGRGPEGGGSRVALGRAAPLAPGRRRAPERGQGLRMDKGALREEYRLQLVDGRRQGQRRGVRGHTLPAGTRPLVCCGASGSGAEGRRGWRVPPRTGRAEGTVPQAPRRQGPECGRMSKPMPGFTRLLLPMLLPLFAFLFAFLFALAVRGRILIAPVGDGVVGRGALEEGKGPQRAQSGAAWRGDDWQGGSGGGWLRALSERQLNGGGRPRKPGDCQGGAGRIAEGGIHN